MSATTSVAITTITNGITALTTGTAAPGTATAIGVPRRFATDGVLPTTDFDRGGRLA